MSKHQERITVKMRGVLSYYQEVVRGFLCIVKGIMSFSLRSGRKKLNYSPAAGE